MNLKESYRTPVIPRERRFIMRNLLGIIWISPSRPFPGFPPDESNGMKSSRQNPTSFPWNRKGRNCQKYNLTCERKLGFELSLILSFHFPMKRAMPLFRQKFFVFSSFPLHKTVFFLIRNHRIIQVPPLQTKKIDRVNFYDSLP
ncbi:MAG: hypothetical protein PHV34_03490 [Verrucomicrobiae bacterium]|nr:hypothetical protein [Verrucomicrobiae bacterium]